VKYRYLTFWELGNQRRLTSLRTEAIILLMIPSGKEKRLLFCIFLGSRILYMLTQPRAWLSQDWEYGIVANNFLQTGSFLMQYYFHDQPIPTAFEPPGLIFILIFFKTFFMPSGYFWAWTILNLTVTTVTFMLFLKIGESLLDKTALRWAAVLYILDVNLCSPLRWINETLYTEFFIVLLVFGLIRWWTFPSIFNEILLGVWMGLGAYFRPTILAYLPLSMVILLYLRRKNLRLPLAVRSVALPLFIMCLVLLPWTVRNYKVFHRIIPVSQYLGYNLWHGWNPQSGGTEYQLNGDPMTIEPWLMDRLKQARTEPEINDEFMKASFYYLRQNPLRWMGQRVLSFLFFWHEHTFWAPHSPFRTRKAFILGVCNLFFLVVFFWSVIPAWKAGGLWRLILLLIAFHSLIYTVIHADIGNRYRLQIEPLLLLPMAYALSGAFSRWKANRNTMKRVT